MWRRVDIPLNDACIFLFTPKLLPVVLTFLTLDAALGAVVFAADGAFDAGAEVSIVFLISRSPYSPTPHAAQNLDEIICFGVVREWIVRSS